MSSKKINLITLSLLAITLSGCVLNPVNNQTLPTASTAEKKDVKDNSVQNEKVFDLEAYNFFYSTTELTVNQGDKVTINLTSINGQHDITISEYNVQSTVTDINNKTQINFIADKVGEFEFYSSLANQKELGLVGKLIVVPKD
jgi:heme/copper-type cytochrome/quinol oxidase subunit 2